MRLSWRSSTSRRFQIEEVEEPVPMDTADAPKENATSSAADAETGDLPQGKMPETAETATTPDVPMEAEAPESSPQGEASGVKVESAESSSQGEASATVDETMGVQEEVRKEADDPIVHDDEVMPPDISPEKDTGLYDQGIWGQVETGVDPEAFRDYAQRAAASAEAENEKAFANMEEASDKKELVNTEEYKHFRDSVFYHEERGSKLRLLTEQQNGYGYSGLYHTGIRDDPVQSFKVQHMIWRVPADAHPQQKYSLKEEHMFRAMCNMSPIYDRRLGRKKVVFRAGDARSTLNDSLMEKASAIRESALEVQDALLARVKELSDSGNPATCQELMYAMLHLFLAAGVDEDEIGDLSLDKIPNPQIHRFGLAEDAPVPVYTSKSKYTALIVNLGSFETRKCAPVWGSTLFVGCTAESVLVLLEKAQAVCRNMLHPRKAEIGRFRSPHPGFDEVVPETLGLLLLPRGPVKCHIGVASHQVDLVVEAVRVHSTQCLMSKCDLISRSAAVEVEHTDTNSV